MSVLPSKRSRAIGIYGPKKWGWRLHGKPYKSLRLGMGGRLHREARLLGRIWVAFHMQKTRRFAETIQLPQTHRVFLLSWAPGPC